MFYFYQYEDGFGVVEGYGLDDQDDQFYLVFGDYYFGLQWEIDGEVVFDVQCGDGEYCGVGVVFVDELEEFVEQVVEVLGLVLLEVDEVEGYVEEDEQVGEGYVGQVEVGGGMYFVEV